MDTDGNYLWATAIEGDHAKGYSIAVDTSANVYTTGVFQDNVDFDPGEGTFNLSSNSIAVEDIFIQKLNQTLTGVYLNKMPGNSSIIIYPNPTKGMIKIEGRDIQKVEIRNVNGQLIRNISIKEEIVDIDFSGQVKGIYFVNIITKTEVYVKKIVLE